MMHNLINIHHTVKSNDQFHWTDSHSVICTPAVSTILFRVKTHALQAPMIVNVTSERIPTHPGIQVRELVKGCSKS